MHPAALVLLSLILGVTALPEPVTRHDGPDPVCHWLCTKQRLKNGLLKARLGPDARVVGNPRIVADQHGESLFLNGQEDQLVVADDLAALRDRLPKQHLTVSAWVSVDTPLKWGGILGVIQDNGGAEKGWILGYDQQRFTFGLASKGGDDGDGHMTYLAGKTRYELGRMYHVVGAYDGKQLQLFVNGALEASSTAQTGAILYPDKAPVVIGGYVDRDENYRHHGRIREVALYDLCAKAKWVAEEFAHSKVLAAAKPVRVWPEELSLVVPPYLQFVTQDGITVMWETSRPCVSKVHYGETDQVPQTVAGGDPTTMHELRLPGLKAQAGYFYKIESIDDRGRKLESPVLTFQTAVEVDTAYAFAVISDTQANLPVAGAIAKHAFGQRPNFVVVPGDLVSTGTDKSHWTKTFFPSMGELVSRVAFFPVLGNHEQNARHYYDYMSLPEPEYYYTFRYGNAQFFMIDSNKEVGPGSEQYLWLERELGRSDATWKFVAYHHPSYSSDENDYGDMWKGKSTHGDLRIRKLVPLYDESGVDIVWNGHIHSYERTWPLKGDRVVDRGTTFMITGGGGGGLETPGPIKPWFQNNVRRGHHYCMVAIAGKTLEFKAFDLENRLFDYLKIVKD